MKLQEPEYEDNTSLRSVGEYSRYVSITKNILIFFNFGLGFQFRDLPPWKHCSQCDLLYDSPFF